MAKKNKNLTTFNKHYGIVLLILVVISLITLFLPVVKYVAKMGDTTNSIVGWRATFSYVSTSGSVSITYATFSFFNMLAYLLPVAGLILSLLFRDSKNILLNLASFACFALSAVLFFLIVQNVAYTEDAGASLITFYTQSLGYGAILGGIANIISAIICAIKVGFILMNR